MFEAVHSETTTASPAEIWELWENPERWPEWNEQLESGELEGAFAVGEKIRVKLCRGGRMQFEITELEPERLFVDESRFPGARFGHEHRLEPTADGCEITHRHYVSGFASGLWAMMLGRKRLRRAVAAFTEAERKLVETPDRRGKRR